MYANLIYANPVNWVARLPGMKQTYKPFTLVGPTVTRPVQDPLAVLNLDS